MKDSDAEVIFGLVERFEEVSEEVESDLVVWAHIEALAAFCEDRDDRREVTERFLFCLREIAAEQAIPEGRVLQ